MTKRSSRPRQQVGRLKAMLLAGSIIATLAGTRLLALQEPNEKETAVPAAESMIVVIPAAEMSPNQLTAVGRRAQFALEPIPQVVRPQIKPVARTRSSR